MIRNNDILLLLHSIYNLAEIVSIASLKEIRILSHTQISDMENIETGLLLMVVGMTTVFAILLIVINLGKGLIVLVNKYAPEEVIVKKQTVAQPATAQTASIPGKTAAAIISAISVTTAGQGKVTKIEKI